MKSVLFRLLPVLGLLLACERPNTPAPASTEPLLKATIDGVPWQTSEVVLKMDPRYGRPTLYGFFGKGNTIESSIEMVLPDSLREGEYPEQMYSSYYENDSGHSWRSSSSSDEHFFTITRYEKQRVWGRFRFTVHRSQPNTADQLPVREIAQGVFENVPVVGIR